MNTILTSVESEPVDMTYMGIGSCPHVTGNEPLEAKYDQLIPVCLHETILRDKKTIRLIHVDPRFDDCKPFLDAYFQKWDLLPVEIAGGYSWVNNQMEVFVMPTSIDHKEHFSFFQKLTQTILNTKGKLLIQEYTGYSLTDLDKQLYEACDPKEKYKRRILLDMTFGTDSGCCTDMTKAQPFYDYDGNFLNFHYINDTDARRWVGISLKVDELLKKKYIGFFLQTLNTYHVDYRRKRNGDTLMYGSSEYSETSTPDDIMAVLQKTLRKSFDILVLVRGVKPESQPILDELFSNYKNYDPYKWYDKVSKLMT